VSAEAYRRQVENCLTLFDGDLRPTENDLHRRREEHADALRFEAAARAQRDLDLLGLLGRRQRTLGWLIGQQHFLVFQPGVERRSVLTYVVLSGRLLMRQRLHDDAEVEALVQGISERFASCQVRPLQGEEVDGTIILAAWLRQRGETDGCVFPIDATVPATQVAEWRAACRELLAAHAPGQGNTSALPPDPSDSERQRQESEQPGSSARGIGALGTRVAD
jgi:hypothetical protein